MIKLNELIVNGMSTADFSFPVYVERNDGFQSPKKKNQLIETQYTTGAIKNEVNAWPPVTKEYGLYCPTATLKELRQIKLWAKDHGHMIADDEPDVFYEILDVDMGRSEIDRIAGYRITIRFTVNPFGYELDQKLSAYQDGEVITNHTNAPMYPKVIVHGNHNQQTFVRIGSQTIYLKDLLTKYTIECKPLEQNVFDQYNNTINNVMRGDFFEISEDNQHAISLGEGITHIEILERWGWR